MSVVRIYVPAWGKDAYAELTFHDDSQARDFFGYLKFRGIRVELVTTVEHVETLWGCQRTLPGSSRLMTAG